MTKLFIMNFSPVSLYFLHLSPRHFPQHHIFKHIHTVKYEAQTALFKDPVRTAQ
jgi:hypothetical protein